MIIRGEFDSYFDGIERVFPMISLLKREDKIVWTFRKQYPPKVVFYDTRYNKFVKQVSYHVKYKPFLIPIGVEVIPSEHNVYENGKGGVISLKNMSLNEPQKGTLETDVKVCWGPVVDTQMKNYNKVVVESGSTLSSQNFGYLNKNGNYNYNSGHIPSPFNEDFSRNVNYSDTAGTAYNALSDFQGKGNTAILINTRGVKDYEIWTPSNTVNDYPAASVCHMYYTEGTKQGDWYLPSAGELGYLMPFWDEVKKCFAVIQKYYGEEKGIMVLDGAGLWTSSENAAKNARYVETNNGLGYSDKTTNYTVRAFIQI